MPALRKRASLLSFALLSALSLNASASTPSNVMNSGGDPLGEPVDWFQPQVGCVEEFVAKPDVIPCLDLSSVGNPLVDMPDGLTPEEVQFWTVDHRPDLNLCRGKEVMRRERANPGNQNSTTVYIGYLRTLGGENLREKIETIYDASEEVEIPPQILFGALYQESLLAGLMIAPDGGNYSCGPAQMNIYEWCNGMRRLTETQQMRLGWPVGIECHLLKPGLIEPFHEIARKLGAREGLPEYQLRSSHYAGIQYGDVWRNIPGETRAERYRIYEAAHSFVQNCSDYRLAIRAKGMELRRLFDLYVPEPMREVGVYTSVERFERQCRRPYPTRYTPLHTGWLLADAIYNAGNREVDLIHHYFQIGNEEPQASIAWAKLTPLDLIEGLHWGGKYNPVSGSIEYLSRKGDALKQSWFKSCIVQRHIARVIQYVTPAGVTIARSLEVGGCAKGPVPEYRQNSSGVKVSLSE